MRGLYWLSVLLWLSAPIADAKEKVLWVLNESFLPGHIGKGAQAGTGFFDLYLRWLVAHLDMFDNEIAEASNSRGFQELSVHDGRCMVGVAQSPERSAVALFSHITLLFPAAGVVVRTDSLGRFSGYRDAAGLLDLAQLAAAPDLRGAYARDRRYGPIINSVITSRGEGLQTVQNSVQALKMLDIGRADYVFGYNFERRYYQDVYAPATALSFLPLSGSAQLFEARVACSRGPIGERVIHEIDRQFDESPKPPPYMAEITRWFDEAEARAAMDPANWSDRPK